MKIPLVIQDKSFDSNGELIYTYDFLPEYFGDTILVNGKVWPYLEVEPRMYRFRVLNGCNSRFLRMHFSPPFVFHQIGTDGGFLHRPVALVTLLLAPAERADILVDFSRFAGENIILTNDAPAPFPDGPECILPEIMQFRVRSDITCRENCGSIPKLPPIIKPQCNGCMARQIVFVEQEDEQGNLELLFDGKRFSEPVDIMPELDSIESWELINPTDDSHPIHVHLVHSFLKARQEFDVAPFLLHGTVIYTGDPIPAPPEEDGPKDTIRADSGFVTRIIIPFSGFPGLYVFHCHILEHEDNQMMRPFRVVQQRTSLDFQNK